MTIFMIVSCSNRNSNGNKKSYKNNKQTEIDTCTIIVKQDKGNMDSSKVEITTWGVEFHSSTMFGNKDNSVRTPYIPALYSAKRYSYCKNDSCHSGYYVIGLKCPNNLFVKRWVSTRIWKKMKETNKKIRKLSIGSSNISNKYIVDYYLEKWKDDYDKYVNHQLICEHLGDAKSPTEQYGLFIIDVWKHKCFYTMCIHSWYDMASCGDNSETSFYTINPTKGKILTLKDIVSAKDKEKLEVLLRQKLAWLKYKRGCPELQDISFLDNINGIALIKEGLLIYFYPDNIGYGYEGQYNVVLPYKQLKKNGINLRVL